MSGRDADDDFERLLRGVIPGTPPERGLGAFVDDVRAAFPVQPLLSEDVHLARIAEGAHLLADKGDPVARPVSNATGRAGHASGLPKRRGDTVKVPIMRSLAAKVVAGLVVLMSMFGGVAFAGALPGGLQKAVANVADTVGVNLPGGNEESEPAEPVEVDSEAPDPGDVETDDQGEDGDVQGEDGDDQGEDGDDQGEDESSDDTETTPPVESEDDQGEDGDDQGENADDQGDANDDQADVSDDQGDQNEGDATDQGDQNDQGEETQDAGENEQ